MRKLLFLMMALFLLLACRLTSAPPPSPPSLPLPPPMTPTAVLPASPTHQPTNTDTPTPRSEVTATPAPTPETAVATPPSPLDPFNQTSPPQRDDITLAYAYRGLTADTAQPTPAVAEPLTVGVQQQLRINNIDNNTIATIDAVLTAVSDHAYFWFDTGIGTFDPDPDFLQEASAEFDRIYETTTYYFDSEDNPGIDGDSRIHIVHASPYVLCEDPFACGLAGYFASSNILPRTVDPNSNEREMFIMNIDQFGTSFYLNVLAHEFRHMIEDNHDRGDADWVAEGSATLAEELNGYPESGRSRGNMFLQNPDQQLNSWTDGNSLPYYGQGYLLNRYIFDQLGADLYREFATHPAYGLSAIDAIAQEQGLTLTSEALWLDWLAALALDPDPQAPDQYRFPNLDLNAIRAETITALPDNYATTVSQYAADYYRLPDDQAVTVNFKGEGMVSLLDTTPPSGEMMWYALRGNYSNPRLTRVVDLSDVDQATLTYDVYVDIEEGYDFAYVSVSTDNGRSWQGLVADNMQGTRPQDDPSDSAYTAYFYTGQHRRWFSESIDLSPYAGQKIWLRFEYVTDQILTYGGLALDNIAIAEIGLRDDVETEVAGWQAEGFVRTPAELPQTWHLQLITFGDDGVPVVESVALEKGTAVSFTVTPHKQGKQPILIVAATAPDTLQPAVYELAFSDGE